MKTIKFNEFLDKVHGCWYGKCLGGAAGAPVEGIKKINEINDFTDVFNPNLPNDDLDIQLLWLWVLENKGTIISSEDLADAWIKKCKYAMSEYKYFTKNYMRGIKPPYTGIINNSFFCEGMGCPIRSEIWGIISAGNPSLAAEYAYMDATLDHSENSVYAEQFLAAVEAMAFFESDIYKLITDGMKYFKEDSRLNECFSLVLEIWNGGGTWQEARERVLVRFGHPDFTNSVQNLGFVVISLLWGRGDMRDTINLALRCGYDSDCTCASAASIIGIIKGYKGLGDELTGLIKDYFICGIDAKRPSDSIRDLALDTAKIALKTPNYDIKITDAPYTEERPSGFSGFNTEKASAEGLNNAIHSLKPARWDIYGPFFDQLDRPADPDIPSPHAPGCNLPDIVCMVNNEVFLGKEYVTDFSKETPVCAIDSYDDFIDIDGALGIKGQICCYAKRTITSSEEQNAWLIIGNNDGFRVYINGENVIERDEMRLWTPFNNYALVNLKEGENEIIIKLLRRGEMLKFTAGFKIYDGNHWHGCRWHTEF